MKHALKEWPAAINALTAGRMNLIFRKGGLYEPESSFSLPSSRSLLFPSVEHQKASMLKDKTSAKQGCEPYRAGEKVAIHGWVEFRELFEIKDPQLIPSLSKFHIWTNEFLEQRLSWKPDRSLFAVTCFTFRFSHPLEIEYRSQYDGCKSWINLNTNLPLPDSSPVLTEQDFQETLKSLQAILC